MGAGPGGVGMMIGGLIMALVGILGLLVSILVLIIFGVALKRLEGEVPYVKLAGILNIVAGATLVLFGLGVLVQLVAIVVEIMMFFKLSE